jgi:hypothetical protein
MFRLSVSYLKALKLEHTKVFEDIVLRTIFVPNREMAGEWRNLYSGEVYQILLGKSNQGV